VIPHPEEINSRIEEANSGKSRPILVMASHGAHLPMGPKPGMARNLLKLWNRLRQRFAGFYYAEVGHCIAGLRRMKPKSPQAREIIRNFAEYLKKQRGRLNYRSRCSGGYPIGSGGIESANKFICHTRMRRLGA
jgi:hypothetical protein